MSSTATANALTLVFGIYTTGKRYALDLLASDLAETPMGADIPQGGFLVLCRCVIVVSALIAHDRTCERLLTFGNRLAYRRRKSALVQP